jgi:hypothetical protein
MPPREPLDLDAVTARWELADRLDAPGPIIESWGDVPAVVAEAKALRAALAASDRAWKGLAAMTREGVTEEDALSYCLFRTILSGQSAPNCWERDITVGDEARGARTARVSVQWADGKSPHELLAEARADRDAALRQCEELTRALTTQIARGDGAEAEAVRLTECLRRANASLEETERSLYLEAQAMERERDHAVECAQNARAELERLRGDADHLGTVAGVSMDHVDDMATENAALRAIIEGRTTPPTDAEIAVHAARGGRWRTTYRVGDPALCGDLLDADAAEQLASAQRARPLHAYAWWATEASGELCAWPITKEAPDGR